MTDGYGSSFVHVLNKTDGAYVPGMSFGGKPTFSCPHKITVDEVYLHVYVHWRRGLALCVLFPLKIFMYTLHIYIYIYIYSLCIHEYF